MTNFALFSVCIVFVAFVTSEVGGHLTKLGCYRDVVNSRALPHLLLTDRDNSSPVSSGIPIDWANFGAYLRDLVCRCAEKAESNNYEVFGVQHYGECWGGKQYDKHGVSKRCIRKNFNKCMATDRYCVGEQCANTVYEINMADPNAAKGPLVVDRGQVTFDSEGNDNENSRYFTRKPHVPTGSSGITLGRGYDLKEKTKEEVIKDLKGAGIKEDIAKKFAKGVGLKGDAAKKFLKDNNLENIVITHDQQKKLFEIVYAAIEKDAKRLATKADVEKAYGKTNWLCLDKKIKEIVIDLRYRGDYTPKTRKKIQKAIADNDLEAFKKLMSDRKYWVEEIGVPEDRFKRRKAFLEKK